ncbi:MAG: hypothetical protein R3A13_06280 [Bdellovibrionota bacterium]
MNDHGTSTLLVKDNVAVVDGTQDSESLGTADRHQAQAEAGSSRAERISPPTVAAQLANTQQRVRSLEAEILAEVNKSTDVAVTTTTSLATATLINSADLTRDQILAEASTHTRSATPNISTENSSDLSLASILPERTRAILTSDVQEHMQKFRELSEQAEKAGLFQSIFTEMKVLAYSAGVPSAEALEYSRQKALEDIIIKLGAERGRALSKAELTHVKSVFETEYKLEREAIRNLEIKYLVNQTETASREDLITRVQGKYSDLTSTAHVISAAQQQLKKDIALDQFRDLGLRLQSGIITGEEFKVEYQNLERSYRGIILTSDMEKALLQGQNREINRSAKERSEILHAEAIRIASSDYKDNPNYAEIRKLFERPELKDALSGQVKMTKEEFEMFYKVYEKERARLWETLNFAEKAWHGTGNVVERVGNWFEQAASDVKQWCTNAVIDTSAWLVEAGAKCEKIWKGIKEITSDVCNWVKNLSWEDIKNGLMSAVKGVGWLLEKGWELVSNPENWLKALKFGADLVVGFFETCFEFGQAIAHGLITNDWRKLEKVAEKTWNGIKKVGSFLYDIAKDLGIVDLVSGVWNAAVYSLRAIYEFGKSFLTAAATLLTTGSLSKAWNALKSGVITAAQFMIASKEALIKGIVGAAKAIWEFSGAADLYNCIKSLGQAIILYGEGRKMEALMAFGSSAMSFLFFAPKLALTIFTFGAGNAALAGVQSAFAKIFMKKVVFESAEKGAKLLLREGTENFAKRITAKIGNGFEKAAIEGVETGIKELDKVLPNLYAKVAGKTGVAREKALAEVEEQVSKIISKNVKKSTVEMFEKSGASEFITKEVLDLRNKIVDLSAKDLRRELMQKRLVQLAAEGQVELSEKIQRRLAKNAELSRKELGKILGKSESKELARQAKNLKRTAKSKAGWEKAGGFGEKIQEDTIKELHEEALKQSAKAREILDNYVEQAGKLHGFEDDFLQSLRKGGYKGIDDGLEKGIRESVEKAWKRAMKEFRKGMRKKRLHLRNKGSGKSKKKSEGKNEISDEIFGNRTVDVYDEKLADFKSTIAARKDLLAQAEEAAKNRALHTKNAA